MDALLVVSFGGPEGPDEVMPFLQRVTAGRNVPTERLAEVAEHYLAVGGISPINAQTGELVDKLREALGADGIPVFWGNRNSRPWLADAMADMAARGVQRAITVFTSAYSSYSGCRQYRENLADAASEVRARGLNPPEVIKVRPYFNDPGFVDASYDRLSTALAGTVPGSSILFTTHSIPAAMQQSSGPGGGQYSHQHEALAAHLVDRLGADGHERPPWDLVFQSRSGPPTMPWLEPDINDRMTEMARAGVGSVVVHPIGFISDHMEVVHDLDSEAAETAAQLGLQFTRVPTVGVHADFVAGLAELVRVTARGTGRPVAFGEPFPAPCRSGCCPNPRVQRAALCEADA